MKKYFIYDGWLQNNLYIVKPEMDILFNTKLHNFKRIKSSHSTDAYLWHSHLGHIYEKMTKRLAKMTSLDLHEVISLPECESFLEGK